MPEIEDSTAAAERVAVERVLYAAAHFLPPAQQLLRVHAPSQAASMLRLPSADAALVRYVLLVSVLNAEEMLMCDSAHPVLSRRRKKAGAG